MKRAVVVCLLAVGCWSTEPNPSNVKNATDYTTALDQCLIEAQAVKDASNEMTAYTYYLECAARVDRAFGKTP